MPVLSDESGSIGMHARSGSRLHGNDGGIISVRPLMQHTPVIRRPFLHLQRAVVDLELAA
jgi:hypothetical protein